MTVPWSGAPLPVLALLATWMRTSTVITSKASRVPSPVLVTSPNANTTWVLLAIVPEVALLRRTETTCPPNETAVALRTV